MWRSRRTFSLHKFSLLISVAIFSPRISFAADAAPAWACRVGKDGQSGGGRRRARRLYDPVSRARLLRIVSEKISQNQSNGCDRKRTKISQRIMSERRAGKFAADLYISGSTSPRIFYRAKILERF